MKLLLKPHLFVLGIMLPGSCLFSALADEPSKVVLVKAVDADNHNIVLNKLGLITLVVGTSEDSQDAAREAGKALYPLQGRPDFQLIVVVDLRDSVATWVPSMVLERMRSSLDEEAIELKPYFLKNGNTSNPRDSSHVVADFNGTLCQQLGWKDGSDDLRAIIFGADGREVKRMDKVEDMNAMENDVRNAIAALLETERLKAAEVAKTQGTKSPTKPAIVVPPLPPPAPVAAPAN